MSNMEFLPLPPIKLKGKEGKQPVFRPRSYETSSVHNIKQALIRKVGRHICIHCV